MGISTARMACAPPARGLGPERLWPRAGAQRGRRSSTGGWRAGHALPAHGAASRHMSRRPAGFPPSRRLLVRDRLIGWRRMQGMGRRRPVSGCEPRGPRRERRRAFRLFKQSIIAFSSNASGWSKLYAARPRPPLSAQQPAARNRERWLSRRFALPAAQPRVRRVGHEAGGVR